MSDIGILNDPLSIALIALVLGSPGLAVGAIIGALAWRRHRVWGAFIGAIIGWAIGLGGAAYYVA